MTDISRLQVQLQVTKLQNKDNPLYQLLHEMIGALKDTSNEVTSLSSSSVDSPVTNNITNNNYAIQSGSGIGNNSSGLSATSMNMVVNNNSVVNNIANNMQLLNGVGSGLGGLHATFIPMSPPASGGITSISIATANGFAGSSSGGITPILTLSTTITGILLGNGTAISAAVAGDFPTLNQNTTGSASTLNPGRNINGVLFDGSADITVPAAAGTLTGTVLASNVVTSSLTTLGTITSAGNVALLNAANVFTAALSAGTGTYPVTLTRLSDATTSGLVSFNGAYALATTHGIAGTAGGTLFSLVPTGGDFEWRVNNVTKMQLSAAGTLAWGGGLAINSSSNVALLNAANVFTGTNTQLFGGDIVLGNSGGDGYGIIYNGTRRMAFANSGLATFDTSGQPIVAFNSTDASGGYLIIKRSGVDKSYWGSWATLIGSGSNDDTVFGAVGKLGLFAGGAVRFGINSVGDWLKGSSIMDSVGTPTCGTDCLSFVGTATDYAFTYLGSGSSHNSVTVNFGHTWSSTPKCTATSHSNIGVVYVSAISTTAVTLAYSTVPSTEIVSVLCRSN